MVLHARFFSPHRPRASQIDKYHKMIKRQLSYSITIHGGVSGGVVHLAQINTIPSCNHWLGNHVKWRVKLNIIRWIVNGTRVLFLVSLHISWDLGVNKRVCRRCWFACKFLSDWREFCWESGLCLTDWAEKDGLPSSLSLRRHYHLNKEAGFARRRRKEGQRGGRAGVLMWVKQNWPRPIKEHGI